MRARSRGPLRFALLLSPIVATGGAASGCGQPGADPQPEAHAQPQPPSFAAEVAPLVHRKCGACHHADGPAPFALLRYAEVRDHGAQIVEVTRSGFMPPWLPEPGQHAFVGEDERRLSPAELDLLAAWVDAGMPEGDPSRTPAPPIYAAGWSLGEPDRILRVAEPFELPADGPDVYRNLVIPVPAGAEGFVRAVELRPGSPRVVHHAVMRVDVSGEAARLDALDEEVGFDGMVFGGARMPNGHFIGWTPGKRPSPGSDARAWQLVPGAELVVQVHMRPSGKPESVQPEVGLYFASGPPSKPGIAAQLSSSRLDIPPGEADYRVDDQFRLPADVDLISIYPHAHYLGKRMRATARLPDGRTLELLRIDDWDFDWQDQYRYVEPIRLPAGSVIAMDYRYDNSAENPRNPASPPVRVQFGPSSTDEMAELILEVEPVDPRDYAALDRAFMGKWLAAQIDGLERALGPEPSAAQLASLAALLARAGRPIEAEARFEAALALDPTPNQAATRVDYALMLADLGRLDDADAQLDAAEQADPGYARTHLVRGNQARTAEQPEQARRAYLRAIAADPTLVEAHNNLGVTLEALGRPREAADAFARACELAPSRALFQQNRGRALEAAGQRDDALAAYRAALERDARDVRSLRGVAWILATHPDPEQRDAREALRVADTAGKLTQGRSPEVLEALAAALAELDRFADADRAMTQALALARSAGRSDLVTRYERQLERLGERRGLGD